MLIKVSSEVNQKLLLPFSGDEVKNALFQMFSTKVSGPYGFLAHFFQRNWSLCGEEVTAMVLRIRKGEEKSVVVNDTFVVLIPKVEELEDLCQFRPISLCNVLYKIASKVVSSRLRAIIQEVISEEQSAFISGRMITDNIITAYECLRFMKKK
jgi:hypothetical protein